MLPASAVAQNSQVRYSKFDDGDRLSKGGGGGGAVPRKKSKASRLYFLAVLTRQFRRETCSWFNRRFRSSLAFQV